MTKKDHQLSNINHKTLMKFEVPKTPQADKVREELKTQSARFVGSIKNVATEARHKLHFQQISKKDKFLSALSYLFLGGLIIRLAKKDRSEFLSYHEKQSILLFVLFTFVLLIPDFGFTILGPILVLLMLINIIVSALGGTLRLIPR